MAFPTIEEVQEMLEESAARIPVEFYEGLNLGIALLPEKKEHPDSRGDLFIMGEYSVDMAGCGISLYYGSFAEVYQNSTPERIAEELDHTMRHEIWHHMEHRAGERGLEIQDEEDLAAYHHETTGRKENGHAS